MKKEESAENINHPGFMCSPQLIGTEIARSYKKKPKPCTHEHVSRGKCLTCGKENV